MRTEQFKAWLWNARGSSERTIGARISNCKRLESYEGDLDQHFDRDRMAGLLDRLTYSTTDERAHAPPRHDIPIDGNAYNGTATLRSAATLYKNFREAPDRPRDTRAEQASVRAAPSQTSGRLAGVMFEGQAAVGRAMWLLREELASFVKRQVAPPAAGKRVADFRKSNRLEQEPMGEWDVLVLLKFMQHMWDDVFRHVLGRKERGLVLELHDWRNKWAHQARLSTEDTDRALDSAARLLRAINAEPQAAEVALLRDRLAETRRTPSPMRAPEVPPNPQSSPHRGSQADAIRQYVVANYVVPWRESGVDVLAIRAGDVEREMGLRNATPNVCSALEGGKFLALANLILVRRDGPRRSTTTTYRYRCAR